MLKRGVMLMTNKKFTHEYRAPHKVTGRQY